MKSEISSFCQEYEKVLTTFANRLQETVSCLEREDREGILKIPLAGLKDIGHRLKSLRDKIIGQQTYLLIFGPLKSGKSTLMNAISGTYVSEVTSLPAYPCLVYVRHGEHQEFTLTRYNDKKLEFTDNAAVQTVISDSHATLAEQIRQAEESGELFDPRVDYPEAIRRVDIRFPVPNLQESNTVLVDTPGLYSRMKFGYDLMTREFRNSAACAVFVVKTDNLFLEQVFAEFNQLLDLFSRIFLVVNIDANKRDLRPDGTLEPSLESRDPDKIITAFQSLAMSAPLRKAFDEGRLCIYPIDLLSAAIRLLQRPPDSPSAAVSAPASPPTSIPPAASENPSPGIPFDRFLHDLTDYLNSADYLQEFIRDSLQQGRILSEETQRLGDAEQWPELQQRRERLGREIAALTSQRALTDDLLATDLESAFARIRTENDQKAEELTARMHDEITLPLLKALDHWFDSDDSLSALQEKHWNPVLNQFAEQIARETLDRLQHLVRTPAGGADLQPGTLRALHTLECSIDDFIRSGTEHLEAPVSPSSCLIRLQSESIPVRKTFLDWLLFRKRAAIHRRLFGPPEAPQNAIPPGIKRKRLQVEGKKALNGIIGIHAKQVIPLIARKSASQMLAQYVEAFCQDWQTRLSQQLARQIEALEARRAEEEGLKQIVSELGQLRETMSDLGGLIEDLQTRHTVPALADVP